MNNKRANRECWIPRNLLRRPTAKNRPPRKRGSTVVIMFCDVQYMHAYYIRNDGIYVCYTLHSLKKKERKKLRATKSGLDV